MPVSQINKDPIIFRQNTQSLASGTTETTLATFTLPPNTLGANGSVRITAVWTITNSANNKTVKVNFGSTSIWNQVLTTTTTHRMVPTLISNRGATNSQVCFPNSVVMSSTTSSIINMTEDTTNPVTITVTGQKALGTEVLALEQFLVELIS
jgi:hypothetical protein